MLDSCNCLQWNTISQSLNGVMLSSSDINFFSFFFFNCALQKPSQSLFPSLNGVIWQHLPACCLLHQYDDCLLNNERRFWVGCHRVYIESYYGLVSLTLWCYFHYSLDPLRAQIGHNRFLPGCPWDVLYFCLQCLKVDPPCPRNQMPFVLLCAVYTTRPSRPINEPYKTGCYPNILYCEIFWPSSNCATWKTRSLYEHLLCNQFSLWHFLHLCLHWCNWKMHHAIVGLSLMFHDSRLLSSFAFTEQH